MHNFNTLKDAIEGEVLEPRAARYEERRQLFNGMIDRRPAGIVQPRNERDVIQAVLFAQAEGLEVAIRGGGHNVAGLALCTDGLVIDFAEMRSVFVDPARRRAIVQPGATWGEFDNVAQRHGLATTGGIISDTGVAGLTLGGGLGWLMGKHGLSCDNLKRARVVLASGAIVEASEAEHADLFWALRGGGGNFGVVVEFEFGLHSVRGVYAGSIVYPLGGSAEAIERFVEVGDHAPDELTLDLVLATELDDTKSVSIDCCYLGSESAGRPPTDGLIGTGSPPLFDSRMFRDYEEWQQVFDNPYRRGRRSYWKSVYIHNFDAGFVQLVTDAIAAAPSPHTMLTFDHVHGAASRVPSDVTAFSHRSDRYLFLVNTNWNDPADDEINVGWTKDVFNEVSKYGTNSVYVNYLSEEGDARVRAAYGSETYDRLAQVKAVYDADNIFHYNQNVVPTQPAQD